MAKRKQTLSTYVALIPQFFKQFDWVKVEIEARTCAEAQRKYYDITGEWADFRLARYIK